MKKAVKIIAIIFGILLLIGILIPIIFEDKIIDLVKKTINNNLNATVDFKDANLTLWSSYPNAQVSLENVSLVNNAPFKGDTLFSAKNINIEMPFKDIFKNEGVNILSFVLNEANIAIKIDKDGNANYDIAKKGANDNEDSSNTDSFTLGLESYQIKNSTISYNDASSKIGLLLSGFNHSGSGNLSLEKSELKTKTTSLVSFSMDSVAYLNKNNIDLDALIGIDLKNNTYRFLKNNVLINQLPLVFDGFIKLNEKTQEVDISFQTPSSDFKNFLALIPKVYSKNIEGVKTTGNFDVKGDFKGVVDDTHIPKFNVTIHSDNASFKYPDLPKSLKNINISTEIVNTTGITKDTYVNIDKLSFKVDDDVFNAKAKLIDITENMKVDANLKGIVNLASLEEIYPAEALKGLKGILDVNATTHFDMASIEKKNYKNTTTLGTFKLSKFQYESDELSSPLKIHKAGITLKTKTVALNSFDAQLGATDIKANGTIHNLLGFIFNDEDIEGNFTIDSNTFSVNDFMVTEDKVSTNEEKKPTTEEQIKIPSFLNATIKAKAKTVLYDNLTLKNVSGTLLIKDQKARLKNIKSNIFGGVLGFNGMVSTKKSISTFEMDLDIDKFNIAESFKSLDLFRALAPIANVIQGQFDSKIHLSGNLNSDFTPNLNTLSGNMLTKLLSSKISTDKSPLLKGLEQNLNFIDTKKLNLKNLKTALTFKDGKVAIKPFTLNYEDIKIEVSGTHNFDTSLAYDAVIQVPAKYLGNEVASLIADLKDEDLKNIKIPVSTLFSGKFTDPKIKTDLKAAVSNLTKQLIARQKAKLIDKGKDEVTNALEGFLDKNIKTKDSTKTDSTKNNTKDAVKDIAKDVLGGLFGKKKKAKKDTIE